jgi:hypothetical protein
MTLACQSNCQEAVAVLQSAVSRVVKNDFILQRGLRYNMKLDVRMRGHVLV